MVYARRQAQGRALLRALRPRLGHPRDPRPAAAGVPRCAPARAGCSSARRPDRPALPAGLHRQVRGAVRRPGRRRGAPRDRRGLLRLPRRRHRRGSCTRARAADAAAAARARLRAGGPAARRPRRAASARWRSKAVVLGDGTDADVVGFAEDELEAAVQVFHVRGGRVRGQRGWVVEQVDDVDAGRARRAAARSSTATSRDADVPREVLVPVLPADAEALERVAHRAARQQGRRAGAPARRQARADGDGRPATPSRRWPATSCAGPATSPPAARRSASCRSPRAGQAPLRIECFDISHVQGTDVVGSMVVFEDGLPRKSEYRQFAIKGAAARTTWPPSPR